MANENKSNNQAGGQQSSSSSEGNDQSQTGDPGRTPGSAEGERETVEEDLRDKAGDE